MTCGFMNWTCHVQTNYATVKDEQINSQRYTENGVADDIQPIQKDSEDYQLSFKVLSQ